MKYFGLVLLISVCCINVDAQVGIGTSAPASSLHVMDDSTATEIRIEHPSKSVLTLMAGSPVLQWSDGSNIKARAQWVNDQLQLYSSPPQGFPISFSYPTLNLSEDRKVGINLGLVATPTEALEVNGRIKVGSSTGFATAGTFQYDATTQSFKGYDGVDWRGFTSTFRDEDGDTEIEMVEGIYDHMNFITNGQQWLNYNGQFQKIDLNKATDIHGNLYLDGALQGAYGALFAGDVTGDKGVFPSSVKTDLMDIDGFKVSRNGSDLSIKNNSNNEIFRVTSTGKVFIPQLGGSGAKYIKVLNSGELYTSNHPQTVQISPYQFSPTTVHLNDIFLDMRISTFTDLKLWHIPNSVNNTITIYRMSKDPTQYLEEPIMQLVIPSNNTGVLQVYSTNTVITPGSDNINTNNYFYFMEATNTVIRHISQIEISGN